MNRIIKQRVEAGDFASSSELIREALRVWQKREEEHQERLAAIRARIQRSVDDPRPSIPLDEARLDFKRHIRTRAKTIS